MLVFWDWIDQESKSALLSLSEKWEDYLFLSRPEANSWGYFRFPNNKRILLGYPNVGLKPQAILRDSLAIIGAGEIVFGIDTLNLKQVFTYNMPTVFHEFVEAGDRVLLRDEVGFVELDNRGRETFVRVFGGPIESYQIDQGAITGSTIDQEQFGFELPA